MLRRPLLSASLNTLLAIAWSWPVRAVAKETQLPLAHNLRVLAAQQNKLREPLVILLSLPGCPYCELVRRSYLLPYRAEGLLQSWQIDTADNSVLLDFAGKATSKAAWVKTLKVKVTPTVLFFDSTGLEIASRLEGASVPDFYGSYLDERLATAKRKLGQL